MEFKQRTRKLPALPIVLASVALAISGTAVAQTTAVPTNVQVTPGLEELVVTWDYVDDATCILTNSRGDGFEVAYRKSGQSWRSLSKVQRNRDDVPEGGSSPNNANNGGFEIFKMDLPYAPKSIVVGARQHHQGGSGPYQNDGVALTAGALYEVRVRGYSTVGGCENGEHSEVVSARVPDQVVLVSNIDEASEDSGLSPDGFDNAQAFLTGSNAFGYTLTSVNVEISVGTGVQTASASIHANDNGSPGAELAKLTAPASLTTGVNAFTHSGLDLASNTRYFIVIDHTAGSAVEIGNTLSNSESGKAGWSINDGRRYRANGGTAWQSNVSAWNVSVVGIVNDSARPTATISAGTSPVTEGTAADFTVTLSSAAPADGLTVNLSVSEAAGSDYVASGNEGGKTLAFAEGDTSKTFSVATVGDLIDEPNGSVTVTLAGGAGYTPGATASASVEVHDDDSVVAGDDDDGSPMGSVTDITNIQVTNTADGSVVTWILPSTIPGNVRIQLFNNTCTSNFGAHVDLAGTATTHTFTGLTSHQTYCAKISPVTGGTPGPTATAIWTRINPATDISNVQVTDTFVSGSVVTWTLPTTAPDNVRVQISNNICTTNFGAHADLAGTATTHTFTGLTISQTYCAKISPVTGGTPGPTATAIWTATAASTMVTPTVSLSASPNPVAEGSPVTVTATLSAPLTNDVTIPYTLAAGTAEPGDYGSLVSLEITAGSTAGTVQITTNSDMDTDDETITVALGSPLPAVVTAGTPSSVDIVIRDGGGGTSSPTPVPRVTGLIVTAVDNTTDQLDVLWNAFTDADAYQVWWALENEFYGRGSDQFHRVLSPATSVRIDGLTAGTRYDVAVQALDCGDTLNDDPPCIDYLVLADSRLASGTTNGDDDGNPDGGNPDGGNPDGGNPGDGNPGDGNPGDGNPGDGNPGGGNPDGGNPGGGNPGGGNPDGGNPDGGIAPATPTFFRAVAGNASASLSWQAADDNGGAAISHYAFGYKKGNEPFGPWTDIPESAPGEANANAYAVPDTLEGEMLYTFRLRAVNEEGTEGDFAVAAVFLPVSTNTEEEELPTEVALLGNYPNPFNPQTRIDYALPSPVHVRLAVYDVQGREVRILENGLRPAGRHTAVFDAGNLPAGVYVYRLQTSERIVSKAATLVK